MNTQNRIQLRRFLSMIILLITAAVLFALLAGETGYAVNAG